jgi:hypothetical protein
MPIQSRTEDHELRLACLDFAVRADCGDPTPLAEQFYAFVTGASDLTPIERMRQALSELERADVT